MLVSILSFGPPFLIRLNVSLTSYSGDDTSDSVGEEAEWQSLSGMETLSFFLVSNMMGLMV